MLFLSSRLLLWAAVVALSLVLGTEAFAGRSTAAPPSRLAFVSPTSNGLLPQSRSATILQAASSSLKPAALPLMDSGKALARSGELLIDLTTALDLYGGALSAAGANVRNAGDSVAQAAASCRFKTGLELVTDELREAATCLQEGVAKLTLAVAEAKEDEDDGLAQRIEPTISCVQTCSTELESAGAALLQRQPLTVVSGHLVSAGTALTVLSTLLAELSPDQPSGIESGQRCTYAAEQMIKAGESLQPVDPSKKKKAVGKSWLKGGT